MINHRLYNCIDDEHQVKIVESLREINLSKGESLFWEGDIATSVYFVKEGNLKVFKSSIEGNETIFDIYDPNSFIALGTLFSNNYEFPASCAAVNNAVVYAINIAVLEDAVVAKPNSAREWIAYMNRRLTTVQKKLSDQIFADSLERLRKLIKYFESKYPSKYDGKHLRISVPITKQEMAEVLNVRRETLSRMLSSLKDKDVCECTYKEIIVDRDWLLKE